MRFVLALILALTVSATAFATCGVRQVRVQKQFVAVHAPVVQRNVQVVQREVLTPVFQRVEFAEVPNYSFERSFVAPQRVVEFNNVYGSQFAPAVRQVERVQVNKFVAPRRSLEINGPRRSLRLQVR